MSDGMLRRGLSSWQPYALAAACVALLVGGCDETLVSPFVPNDYHYSLYGFVDTDTDSQFVRIVPLRRSLPRPTSPEEPLDVTVVLRDVRTGLATEAFPYRRRQPDGSLGLRFADSTYGHVYLALRQVWPGETYELEVRRNADGRTSRAQATVPTVGRPVVEAPVVEGDSVWQTLVWPGVRRPPHRITLVWRVFSPLFTLRPKNDATVALTLATPGEETAAGLRVTVNLTHEARRLREYIDENHHLFADGPPEDPYTFPLGLVDIRMQVTLLDAQWAAAAAQNDPGTLAQPGAFSNVENGFGFFGAVGQGSADWEVGYDIRQRIGLL